MFHKPYQQSGQEYDTTFLVLQPEGTGRCPSDMDAYLNEMVSMGSEADRMRTSLRARGI